MSAMEEKLIEESDQKIEEDIFEDDDWDDEEYLGAL